MLVSDITRKVQRLFGDSSSEIIIVQADIYDWVNEAQLLITRKTHCLTNTNNAAASTYPATLPADWIITKRVTYDTPELPLHLADIEDLDAYSIDPTYADAPQFYYFFNGKLNLYPNPGGTKIVHHYYVKTPTNVTAPGDTPSLPISFHEDLVRFCLMRAHERNENSKGMENSTAIFQSTDGLRQEEATVADDDYYVVRDDPGEVEVMGNYWY